MTKFKEKTAENIADAYIETKSGVKKKNERCTLKTAEKYIDSY